MAILLISEPVWRSRIRPTLSGMAMGKRKREPDRAISYGIPAFKLRRIVVFR